MPTVRQMHQDKIDRLFGVIERDVGASVDARNFAIWSAQNYLQSVGDPPTSDQLEDRLREIPRYYKSEDSAYRTVFLKVLLHGISGYLTRSMSESNANTRTQHLARSPKLVKSIGVCTSCG